MSALFLWTLTEGVLCGSIYMKVSVSFDMNSHKKYVVFFCINFLKVSKLFHKNSKIFQLLFFKSCILVNLVKTEVFYSILKEDYYSLFLF